MVSLLTADSQCSWQHTALLLMADPAYTFKRSFLLLLVITTLGEVWVFWVFT